MPRAAGRAVRRILVVDIGGTHVKGRLTGRAPPFKFVSGPKMTPKEMVASIRTIVPRSEYDAASLGYPGPVVRGRIVREPPHLGSGWVGFDFRRALDCPVRIVNDAAMQALGSYEGGRMLFLGLGTGLGSAMILDGELAPMELAHLPYKKGRNFEEYVGEQARRRLGPKKWRTEVFDVVARLSDALQAEYVVLGGGNVRKLHRLPPGARAGDNDNAFTGGFRMWESDRTPGGELPRPATRRARR